MMYLTRAELFVILLSGVALFGTAFVCFQLRWRAAAAVAVLSLPALYLAVERGSQYLP
jgi:hypothetical protein